MHIEYIVISIGPNKQLKFKLNLKIANIQTSNHQILQQRQTNKHITQEHESFAIIPNPNKTLHFSVIIPEFLPCTN